MDLRLPSNGPTGEETTEVAVMNAHEHADLGLHSSGFELITAPSAITDFYDCDHVMGPYHQECKSIAQELTGAHTTFTFDHIIREPGLQYSGGGTPRAVFRRLCPRVQSSTGKHGRVGGRQRGARVLSGSGSALG